MNTKNISYLEYTPDHRLTDYIKSYWYFSIRTNTPTPFDILPDGYFDLIVLIRENQIVCTQLTGIWNKSKLIKYAEDTEIFGIRFKPLAIGGLFKFNIKNALNDFQNVSLKDFDFNEQIMMDNFNRFPEFVVHYFDKQFLKLISQNQPDNRLKNCFNLIDNSYGNISVEQISKNIGLSTRQLHRLVTNMIGIGIKDYSKIVRFKKSLQDVKADRLDNFDYYDQSHYIRETKLYTGLTPEKLNIKNNVRFIQYYDFDGI